MDSEEPVDLGSLPREQTPPVWLEERIVAELKERGRIRRTPPAHRWLTVAIAAAASILLFVSGMAAGNYLNRPTETMSTAPRFILLLYEDAGFLAPKPDESASRVDEYRDWARKLASRGLLVAGEKLEDAAGLLLPEEATAPRETGLLAGYFIVAASGRPEAIAIARDCPHLRYGGRIVVRQIDPT